MKFLIFYFCLISYCFAQNNGEKNIITDAYNNAKIVQDLGNKNGKVNQKNLTNASNTKIDSVNSTFIEPIRIKESCTVIHYNGAFSTPSDLNQNAVIVKQEYNKIEQKTKENAHVRTSY